MSTMSFPETPPPSFPAAAPPGPPPPQGPPSTPDTAEQPYPSGPPPSGSGLRRPMVAAIVVVVLAAFGGAALAHVLWPSTSSPSTTQLGLTPGGLNLGSGTNPLLPQGGSSTATPASDAAVAARISPAVVDVNTITGQGAAAGTGMVVTSTGEVITNNHVISGATQISAYDVGNGRTYTARVIGYDRSQDVAVIQLEGASGLATVPLGDSSTLQVGSGVITIGNAGGVGGTPSAAGGAVAALHQSITAGDLYEPGNIERLKDVIQISGSLQPGDSGGPLVSGGKVVGMDTAASTHFRFQSPSPGRGFAIPINQVLSISRQIFRGQSSSVVHIGPTALIGVYVANKTRCSNPAGVTGGGSGAAGAVVCGVVNGTPAASTALATSGTGNGYDTITSLDGRAVTSAASLLRLMDTHHPGDQVVVGWVDPAGTSHSATIALIAGPAD
jgi:S1-C subfamily serine protease